uniref:Uncharacterized protein n=1 Tax=Anguilla anguilla TaxID=7936 RepID=A0A0E9RA67_ANGAN
MLYKASFYVLVMWNSATASNFTAFSTDTGAYIIPEKKDV